MKLTKTRYEFGCGFCGAGGKKYILIEDMDKASRNHSCRRPMIRKLKVSYFEEYSRPVETEI